MLYENLVPLVPCVGNPPSRGCDRIPIMRFWKAILLVLSLSALATAAETLDIYFIDVEGGQATLIVSPSGESMLVDAGWPGFGGRDAGRIVSAARKAGLNQIDYMLLTHYHTDHVGGIPAVASRMPIVRYVDHGDSTESGRPNNDALAKAYYEVRERGSHMIVRPGDTIPIKGLKVDVVAARGKLIDRPLPEGGGANPLCASVERKREDTGENGKSVAIIVNYGKFRFADLADLTWNFELDLACPVNKLGEVDAYLTTHHGLSQSGPAAIVHALNPRVAIMNNGYKKGGAPAAWKIINDSPRLERFWQLHYTTKAGDAANTDNKYIANVKEECDGYGLKLSAKPDGSFSVTNLRTGLRESYGTAK